MHEVDMTKALIVTLQNWVATETAALQADDPNAEAPQIQKVHLVVGAFTCVEPVGLQFAFEAQTRGTFLDGATLEIQETPLIAFCHRCQKDYRPEIGIQYACPDCQSPMDDIRSGRELKIDRVEYRNYAPNL